MPKLQDFHCADCQHTFEYLSMFGDDRPACAACQSANIAPVPGGTLLTTIIPAHMTSKKSKAGHQHTHGDRPATKIQSQVPSKPFKGSL